MHTARLAALLIALTAAAALAGCGGGSDTATTGAAPAPAPRGGEASLDKDVYVQRAEAICRHSVAKTQALGRRIPQIVSSAPSPQQGITNGLVGPGITILSDQAAELRSLGPPPPSPALATYLGMFDPIIELAQQRLQAGRAGDSVQAHRLELMVASLGGEQSSFARAYGLRACSIEFNKALGGSG